MNMPVSQEPLELDDELNFLLFKAPSLDVWPKVVQPPKPAALAAPI